MSRAQHLAAFYRTQAYSRVYQRRLLAFLLAEHPVLHAQVMKELAREDRKAPARGIEDRNGSSYPAEIAGATEGEDLVGDSTATGGGIGGD